MLKTLSDNGVLILPVHESEFRKMSERGDFDEVWLGANGRRGFCVLGRSKEGGFTRWFAVAKTDQQVRYCKSVNRAHQWIADLGITSYQINTETWSPGTENDPHRNTMESRHRHALRREAEKCEASIFERILQETGFDRKSLLAEIEDRLNQVGVPVKPGSIAAWAEGELVSQGILSAVVDIAVEEGIFPKDRLSALLYLRGVLFRIPSAKSAPELEDRLPGAILRGLHHAFPNKDGLDKTIHDAAVFSKGGYW